MKITDLAKKEAQALLRICDPLELDRMDFDNLDGNSTEQLCLYGMLTGDPDSLRAMQLICQCTDKVICNDVMNDGKMIPVSELKAFIDHYDDGLFITETGRIIDYTQRTLCYVSPLEVYVPSFEHPERQQRIEQLRYWLSL